MINNWYSWTNNFSLKTPKPWPRGKPGLKKWNSYGVKTVIKYVKSYGSVTCSWRKPSAPISGVIYNRDRNGAFGYCFTTSPVLPATPNPNTGLAAQRLLTKIKSMDWNVGEGLGELHQTVGLIVNTANRVANGIVAVKQGNVRKAMDILDVASMRGLSASQKRAINRRYRTRRERDIASDWLAINYGVIPLMNDVKSAIEHVQNRNDWNLQAQASATEYNNYVVRSSNSAGPCPGLQTVEAYLTVITKAKYVVQYGVDTPFLVYLRSLGLTNVPSLVYELTPGSLILDWFLPVGSWLSNMDATYGCSFLKGVLVRKKESEIIKRGWLTSNDEYASNGAGEETYSVTTYARDELLSFPANPRPQFKNPASPKHLANGLAFLVQAVHR